MKIGKLLQNVGKNWQVYVFSLLFSIGLFVFYKMETIVQKIMVIPLHVVENEDYIVASRIPASVRLSLRGSADSINALTEDSLEASIDLSSKREEGQFVVIVDIQKRGTALTAPPFEVAVDPFRVVVTQEKRLVKSFKIVPNFLGDLKPGFQMTEYEVRPSSIMVVGPRSQIEELNSISTEGIDISYRNEDFSEHVWLVKPSATIQFPGGDLVEVRAKLHELIDIKQIDSVLPQIKNLNPEWQLDSDLIPLTVVVKGNKAVIEKLQAKDVVAILDAQDIDQPGKYTLELQFPLGNGYTILSHSLSYMEVAFKVADILHEPQNNVPPQENDPKEEEINSSGWPGIHPVEPE